MSHKQETCHHFAFIHMLNRLPYELFRRIIRDMDDGFSSPLIPPGPEIFLPPTTASHVCRSWRAALLSDPSMWTCLRIPQMKPQQVTEFLHRSVHAPLNVFVETTEYRHDTTLQLLEVYQEETIPSVFKEINRFKRLQINVSMQIHHSFRTLAHEVIWSLNQPAPMLQKFYMNVELHHQAEIFESRNFNRFLENVPNLKHILRQVSEDFHQLSSFPCFRNLYSLNLRLRRRIVIPCDIFLDILESSPSLRTLEIRPTREQPAFIPPGSADRRVVLPHLRSLALKDFSNVDLTNLVLGHVFFPRNVNYYIRCLDFQQKISQTGSLMNFIAQQQLTYLQMYFYRWDNVHLYFHEQHPKPHADTFSTSDDGSHEPSDSLHNLLQMFKLSDITCLNLQYISMLTSTPTRLVNTFPLLVNLKIFQIHYDFWDALRSDGAVIPASILMLILPLPLASWIRDGCPSNCYNGIQDDTLLTQCPCPLLHTLDIGVKREWTTLDKTYAILLKACSDIRRRAGHPLEVIMIRCLESNLTDDAAAILQSCPDFPVTILKEN